MQKEPGGTASSTGSKKGSGTKSSNSNSRQNELGNRATAAYRLGLRLNPELFLNPNATQLVSL
ncbi:hypothetical protein [Streptomyces sp. NPDC051662]|uniref:hypothetical protein n=1 Tax=Streptomyces sp. NPDC051662 TaxID=3154750 RepID=UPI00342A6D59